MHHHTSRLQVQLDVPGRRVEGACLCEEALASLVGEDALDGALRARVRRDDGHGRPELCRKAERLERPARQRRTHDVAVGDGAGRRCAVLEEQVEALRLLQDGLELRRFLNAVAVAPKPAGRQAGVRPWGWRLTCVLPCMRCTACEVEKLARQQSCRLRGPGHDSQPHGGGMHSGTAHGELCRAQ